MTKLPEHLFKSSDGALYDTRVADWTHHPLRAIYETSASKLDSLTKIKAALRSGQYAWPGGYQLYFITADGAALSFDTVRKEWRQIVESYLSDNKRSGWHVVGCEINYEDSDLYCEHSGEKIPAAYGDDLAEIGNRR